MNIKYRVIVLLLMSTVLTFGASIDVRSFFKNSGINQVNTLNDIVNGNTICANGNDNSNSNAGCDMSLDTAYDVTTDSYGSNKDTIVRTGDSFTATAAWNATGTTSPVTISASLPDGLRWVTPLSGLCKAGSSVSANGRDLICVRADYNTNGASSYSEDMDFLINVSMKNQNGTTTGEITFTVDNTDVTSKSDATDITGGNGLTITASPRWNTELLIQTISPDYNQSGVLGYKVDYLFYLEVDEVLNETDTFDGYLGSESLGNNFTLNITADTSAVSTNAELVSCEDSAISYELAPYSYLKQDFETRSVATNENDLNLTCIQNNKGDNITINYSSLDATLDHFPLQNQIGNLLPVNRKIAALGRISLFIPYSDVIAEGTVKTDSDGDDYYELRPNLKLTNFSPSSISGTANFNGASESILDNNKETIFEYYPNGKAGISFYKRITTTDGSLTTGDGKGVVTPNELFSEDLFFKNTGSKDLNNTILCDVIDINKYTLADFNNLGNGPTQLLAYNGLVGEVEYATGYVGNNGNYPFNLQQDNNVSIINECKDNSVNWTTDWSRLGLENITKVRMRTTVPMPKTAYGHLYIGLKAKGKDLNNNVLSSGTLLPNYIAIKDDIYFPTRGGDADNWVASAKILDLGMTGGDITSLPRYPEDADRAILIRAKARIGMAIPEQTAEIGDERVIRVMPTFTSDSISSEEGNVTVQAHWYNSYMTYVPGSSNWGEPSILVKGGLTTLRWNLGVISANKLINELNYKVKVEATAVAGNTAIYSRIEAPDVDLSPTDVRETSDVINIAIPVAMLTTKMVHTPFVPTNTDISYEGFIRNATGNAINNIDIIDILPFNGDGSSGFDMTIGTNIYKHKRNPATSFNGTSIFKNAQSGYACANIGTYEYTNRVASELDISPKAASNQVGGSTTWCLGDINGPSSRCSFVNSEVTAVRYKNNSVLNNNETCSLKLTIEQNSNLEGDIYTNTIGGASSDVTLPIVSNDVSAVVPSTGLGDFVWEDSNRDGIQDANETGLSGINLNLLDINGNRIQTTTTDANGGYLFKGLAEGNYSIEVNLSGTSYSLSPSTQGTDDTIDSDIDTSTYKSSMRFIANNQIDRTLDIGIITPQTVAPVSSDINSSINVGATIVIDFLSETTDGDTATADLNLVSINGTTLTGNEQNITVPNGMVQIDVNGATTFVPNSGFVGTSSFSYEVSDGTDTSSASVNITVTDTDTDGDGVIDSLDLDDDNDGVLDSVEGNATVDTDNDGIPNYLDLDSDNDGIPDNVEAQTTNGYIAPTGTVDANGTWSAIYGVNGLIPIDTDEDNITDMLDSDSDNDGIFDIVESGQGLNADTNGSTTDPVGANGLADVAESADDYTDVNGNAYNGTIFTLDDSDDDTLADGTDANATVKDLDYRDNVNLINAIDDSFIGGVNGLDGGIVGDITLNDTLNALAVEVNEINITLTGETNLSTMPSVDADGNLTIPANTPLGSYYIEYKICEVLNPSNCDEANVTVEVGSATILGTNDSNNSINGLTGGTAIPNVTSNDTLNGNPVRLGTDVNITAVTGSTLIIDPSTGAVTVPVGTPAGDYSGTYTLCEILNPSNCVTREVNLSVQAALIDAVDDTTPSVVNGLTGGVVGDITTNDTLNGVAVIDADMTITLTGDNNISTMPTVESNGTLNIPVNTPVGTYYVEYKVCENLNPTNCDEANATVEVSSASLIANADSNNSVNGTVGGVAIANVISNDTLNGSPITLGTDANITNVTNTTVLEINSTTGAVTVPVGSVAGTYVETYTICENLNPTNCDDVNITIVVTTNATVSTEDNVTATSGNVIVINVLSNDIDVDGDIDPTTVKIIDGNGTPVTTLTVPNEGIWSVDPTTGAITFTPEAGFTGDPSPITYVVSDTTGNISTPVAINVDYPQTPPVANDDTLIGTIGNVVRQNIVNNDVDAENDIDPTTVKIIDPSDSSEVTELIVDNEGTWSVDLTTGEIRFTPIEGLIVDPTPINYVVSDGTGKKSNEATIMLDYPQVVLGAVDVENIEEDTPIVIDVLSNDRNGEDKELEITQLTQPANGTVSIENGEVKYVPNENFNGTDTFTYVPSDGTVVGKAVTVTITVTPVNDAPMAVADNISTLEETAVVIDVLGNDTDVDDNDTITLVESSLTEPSNGTVEIVDGNITYTPNSNYTGVDSFTYTIVDKDGLESTTTVKIDVGNVNDAPVALDDRVTTDEDSFVTIDVLSNDSDVDGDTLSIKEGSISRPSHGTVTLNNDGTVTYVPNPNFNGTDSFTYVVQDGNAGEATATVEVIVNPVNDAPLGNPDSATTNENTPVTIDVLDNDSDVEGSALEIVISSQPENGGVEIVDGKVVYAPNTNFSGTDSFSYVPNDGTDDGDEVAVSIKVVSNTQTNGLVDDVSDNNNTLHTPVIIDVLANDNKNIINPNTLQIEGTANAGDSLTVEGEGVWSIEDSKIVFTPEENFAKNPSPIKYTLENQNAEHLDSATVTLYYQLDAEVKEDKKVADLSEPVTVNVLENDSGNLNSSSVKIELPEGFLEEHPDANLSEDGKILIVPNQGTWRVNADGTITYVAEKGIEIVDPTPISYSVEDTKGKRLEADANIVLTQSEVESATDTVETCEDYNESSVSLNATWSLILMALLGTLFGVLFFRKEKH